MGKPEVMYQQLLDKLATATLGAGATASIVAENGRVSLKKYYKYTKRRMRLDRAFRTSAPLLERLQDNCVAHMRPVTSPLALISQIQRSGGSLLSQLFDGHPEIDAHPHELKIGYPRKYTWPKLDLGDGPKQWFATLFERSALEHARTGYKKQKNLDESFLFLFLPALQWRLFSAYLDRVGEANRRHILNAYMTSYFGAWLNNQNNGGEKKWVTAFTARLSMKRENVRAFFDVYPDGRLISIVRDPKNWYPSAARHRPHLYADIKAALDLWQRSAAAILWNKAQYGDRVCILRFEDLVGRTEAVVRHLADFLEISFDEILLTPTFNRIPIRANTSFEAKQHGIIDGTLKRHKSLSPQEIEIIDKTTSESYREVLSQAAGF
jgi:hypothetical protein